MSKGKQRFKKKGPYLVAKILIVAFLIAGFMYTQDTQSNSMQLLAVNEDNEGNPVSGSLIDLKLTVEPGSGQTYVNLNTIEEVDTQISIINSQRIACRLFELPCDQYDFHYEFSGSALVLKGPSASAAIGVLVAKTLNGETIDNSTVITGSLNSGGIIGAVGGIQKKIDVADNKDFSKVLIPFSSQYNSSKSKDIEVVEVLDLVDAYNNFNGRDYSLPTNRIGNDTQYEVKMGNLAEQMCSRSNALKDRINPDTIKKNSSLARQIDNAEESYNSSREALENGNYYSAGSFCYNANLNYRTVLEKQKNLTQRQREEMLKSRLSTIKKRQAEIRDEGYKEQIQTINDFYIYLLLTDRLEEAGEFANRALEDGDSSQQNLIGNGNTTNVTINRSDTSNVDKARLSAYSAERLYTVNLWEQLIDHTGRMVKFSDISISRACERISREISVKYQLLNQYNLPLFSEEVNGLNALNENPDSNKYLCLYQGLELKGRMDTVLNSLGLQQNESEFYINEVQEITESRIQISGDKDNFPFIPYIYHEYSKELLSQGDTSSALLYSNFALSYADIDIYLENPNRKDALFNVFMQRLFNEPIFFGGLLVMVLLL